MDEIRKFTEEKTIKKKKTRKSDTHKATYELYKEGLSIDEIAERRKLKSATIYSHIAKLYSEGKEIDIFDFVTESEVEAVKKAKAALNSPTTLKAYFDHLNEQIDYFKIRLALGVIDAQ